RSAGTGNLSRCRYRKANNTTTEANQKGHLVGAKKIAAGDTITQAIRKISQPCSSLLSQPCSCSSAFANEATNRPIKAKLGSKYRPLVVPARESAKKTGRVPATQRRRPSRCTSGRFCQWRQVESAANKTKGVHGNRSAGVFRK